MSTRFILTLTAFLCTLSVVCADPALTIYNQDFAVVRDSIPFQLQRGENQVTFTETTAHVEPQSVILRDPEGKVNLQILEQNYRADPISQQLLLSYYEGKEIDFQSGTNIIRGKIIRSGYVPHQSGMQRYGNAYAMRQQAYAHGSAGQPVIEVDGRLQFSLPGQPLFPALTDDAILKPTLHWIIEADRRAKFDAELCYITGGMSWDADYNLISPEKGDEVDLVGWVTMDNQSGKTFRNARIKLMAGDVSKIQEGGGMVGMAMRSSAYAEMDAMGPPVTEKSFDDFHLYTLQRPTTLRDRETKQVEFVRAGDVKSSRFYVYDGAKIDWGRYRNWNMESIRNQQDYGTQSNPKVWIMREFENSEENNLGIPLPRGRLRFYRRDDDGQLEFTGENVIDHTPKDEMVRVYTGNAFDLVGERKRTNYNINHNQNWLDETFEIKVRNRKEKESVEIRVVEHLYRWINWEIMDNNHEFTKTDSQTVEFRVKLNPGEEKTITYRAHYTW